MYIHWLWRILYHPRIVWMENKFKLWDIYWFYFILFQYSNVNMIGKSNKLKVGPLGLVKLVSTCQFCPPDPAICWSRGSIVITSDHCGQSSHTIRTNDLALGGATVTSFSKIIDVCYFLGPIWTVKLPSKINYFYNWEWSRQDSTCGNEIWHQYMQKTKKCQIHKNFDMSSPYSFVCIY